MSKQRGQIDLKKWMDFIDDMPLKNPDKEKQSNKEVLEKLENMSPVGYTENDDIVVKSSDYFWLVDRLGETLENQPHVIKTKNGRPTVIEYEGDRYILQHPSQRERS